MKVVETKVYTFNELNESAKQVAIKEFLNSDRELFWMSENIESLKKGLEHFGFKMGNRYSIDYSNANVSNADIECTNDEISNLSEVRLWKYLNKNCLTYFCNYDKKYKDLLEGNCPFTGYCADENFLDKVREFMKLPTNITFYELMEECVNDVFKDIESEYDWQNSEEFAIQELNENDDEYTEDGRIFNY